TKRVSSPLSLPFFMTENRVRGYLNMKTMRYALSTIYYHLKQINEFDVYANNSTHSLHNNYVYKFALPFERIDDHIGSTLLLQRNWYHSITISIVYFILIKFIQRKMRDREAFNLRIPLFFWNASLAIFSLFGFLRYSEEVFYSVTVLGMYKSLCYTIHTNGVAAFWALLFALSKLVELGDTLFIVLRKKPLIFLHYYHHVAVLICAAHSGAEHAAPGRFFVCMNFFVHAIMYSYYASTAYGFRPSRLIAMTLTTLQITQMLGGLTIVYLVYNIKTKTDLPCQQSMGNLLLSFIIYTTFAALFIQFYIKNYFISPKRQQKKID
uniref:Elongation of very long chain fatty acids protein n=1 Tax=Parascaris univalens TaxID=6257 RepID=A0A915AY29_PARUN